MNLLLLLLLLILLLLEIPSQEDKVSEPFVFCKRKEEEDGFVTKSGQEKSCHNFGLFFETKTSQMSAGDDEY